MRTRDCTIRIWGEREMGDKVCVFTDALSRCEEVMLEIFGERTFQGTVEINFRREGYLLFANRPNLISF